MSGELNDDEYMSAMPLAAHSSHDTYRAVSIDQYAQDKFRSVENLDGLQMHVESTSASMLGARGKSFDPLYLSSGAGLPGSFGPAKSDFDFAQTLLRPQKQQAVAPVAVPPELPLYYERSTSLVCPHTAASDLRDIVVETLTASPCTELAIEQDEEFALRARALAPNASAVFLVYFFQWPQGGVLVEFQRRSGDLGAFLTMFKYLSAALESHTDSPAAKARSEGIVPLSKQQQEQDAELPMLSLAMPSLSSMSSSPFAGKSMLSTSSSSSASPSSSATRQSESFTLSSLPSGLVDMLKSDILEHQQQATQVFCHLSGSMSKDTSLPADFPDLLAGLLRSPDFDVARCAIICVANAAKIARFREEFAQSFDTLRGLLDVLAESSSTECLGAALRAVCNLCESPDACDGLSRLRWRQVLERHLGSRDASLREAAAKAFKCLGSAQQ